MATPTAAPISTPNHPALRAPAPLAAAAALPLGLALVAEDGATVDVLVVTTAAAPEEGPAAAEVAPAKGAVDCPDIWAATAGLKVPVMLFKLEWNYSEKNERHRGDRRTHVNFAEKARAGNCGAEASWRPRDSNRMKLFER